MTTRESCGASSLRDLRAFLLDMDGVIYRGNTALPGAADFLAGLRASHIPFLFLTNNSTTPPRLVAERLVGMGIPASASEVLSSSEATAAALTMELPGGRVLVIGEMGIREALAAAGLRLTDDHERADAVVVGMDRHCTYAQLRDATLAIRRGARFIATNADRTLPTEIGLIPGAGALVVRWKSPRTWRRVIGKPLRYLRCSDRLGAQAESTAAVGDRPETDILGGQRAGLHHRLLTGAGTPQEFSALSVPPIGLPGPGGAPAAYFGLQE
jgi:4-nitrophenyl phosphatase